MEAAAAYRLEIVLSPGWASRNIDGRDRGRPQAIHPPACLTQFPMGNSGEAAKNKDVFLGGFFLLLPGIILGTVLHGPTQCDQRSLAA